MPGKSNLAPLSSEADPQVVAPCSAAHVALRTEAGTIQTRLHRASGSDEAILWVFGAGGGVGGPAGAVYARLGEQFCARGVTSLEVDYRHAGSLESCIEDTRTGIAYLRQLGSSRIVLVGHSFGGAVVLRSAADEPKVIAVATLSSQTAGVGNVAQLAPRALLFVHGEDDEVLPATLSRDLHARA